VPPFVCIAKKQRLNSKNLIWIFGAKATNQINDELKMNWIILIVAGLFEVAFAASLGKAKETTGTEATFWYLGFLVCLSISMFLLVKATQEIPIGTAYAVWTGIGAIGTVLLGILIFKEPATFWRLFFISTLIISIVGLKLVSGGK
jgi:quaternary ammonium compound-resistance protein SugE